MSSDPYYDNVSLLLHCDGDNGSTAFIDNSPNPKTVNGVSAAISTALSKFGGASLNLNADGKYIHLDGSADFAFGTGDFTIEFWHYFANVDSMHALYMSNPAGVSSGDYPAILMGNNTTGKLQFNKSTTLLIQGTTTVVAGNWYHIAVSRSGTSTRFFLNGVQEGGTLTDTNNYINGSEAPYIGGYPPSLSMFSGVGNFDDIRITKGVARYTANFTPPIEAFPNYSGSFTDTPVQGIIYFTGLTPVFAEKFTGSAIVLQIDVTGLTPDAPMNRFTGAPAQRAIELTGLIPGITQGLINAAEILQIGFTGLLPSSPMGSFIRHALAGSISIAGLQPSALANGFNGVPAQRFIAFSGLQPDLINRTLYPIVNHWVSTHYKAYITGHRYESDRKDDKKDPLRLADFEMPISSFQMRMDIAPDAAVVVGPKIQFTTTISAIAPGIDAYIDEIALRVHARLKINRIYNYQDGSQLTFEICRAKLETINTNEGGRAGVTGTLSAFKNTAAITPKTIELFDPITRSIENGRRRYRCRIDPRVRPLDTVIINDESFVVGNVLQIIDVKTAIMEVQELLSG